MGRQEVMSYHFTGTEHDSRCLPADVCSKVNAFRLLQLSQDSLFRCLQETNREQINQRAALTSVLCRISNGVVVATMMEQWVFSITYISLVRGAPQSSEGT